MNLEHFVTPSGKKGVKDYWSCQKDLRNNFKEVLTEQKWNKWNVNINNTCNGVNLIKYAQILELIMIFLKNWSHLEYE